MVVGEHTAHVLTPHHGRSRDLPVGMLPGRDAQLDLVHGLEGDDVGRALAVRSEPRLLLLLGPDLLCHRNPRLDGRHVLAPPSLRHIGFIRRSLENARSFARAGDRAPCPSRVYGAWAPMDVAKTLQPRCRNRAEARPAGPGPPARGRTVPPKCARSPPSPQFPFRDGWWETGDGHEDTGQAKVEDRAGRRSPHCARGVRWDGSSAMARHCHRAPGRSHEGAHGPLAHARQLAGHQAGCSAPSRGATASVTSCVRSHCFQRRRVRTRITMPPTTSRTPASCTRSEPRRPSSPSQSARRATARCPTAPWRRRARSPAGSPRGASVGPAVEASLDGDQDQVDGEVLQRLEDRHGQSSTRLAGVVHPEPLVGGVAATRHHQLGPEQAAHGPAGQEHRHDEVEGAAEWELRAAPPGQDDAGRHGEQQAAEGREAAVPDGEDVAGVRGCSS